jgi:hypothetical protein
VVDQDLLELNVVPQTLAALHEGEHVVAAPGGLDLEQGCRGQVGRLDYPNGACRPSRDWSECFTPRLELITGTSVLLADSQEVSCHADSGSALHVPHPQ